MTAALQVAENSGPFYLLSGLTNLGVSILNHITVVAHGAPGSLARTIQESPQLALDLFYAAQEAVKSIPNPLNPARVRLQAAIDLMDLGHIPRRPLPLRLELEAAVVGAQLDGESIEQGESA